MESVVQANQLKNKSKWRFLVQNSYDIVLSTNNSKQNIYLVNEYCNKLLDKQIIIFFFEKFLNRIVYFIQVCTKKQTTYSLYL